MIQRKGFTVSAFYYVARGEPEFFKVDESSGC